MHLLFYACQYIMHRTHALVVYSHQAVHCMHSFALDQPLSNNVRSFALYIYTSEITCMHLLFLHHHDSIRPNSVLLYIIDHHNHPQHWHHMCYQHHNHMHLSATVHQHHSTQAVLPNMQPRGMVMSDTNSHEHAKRALAQHGINTSHTVDFA